MAVHARAVFDYTIDDQVDVELRNLNRLASARALARNAAVLVGLLFGVATSAVVKLLGEDTSCALAMGVAATVVYAIIFLARRPAARREAVRRILLEHLGPGPFTCSVELHDDHMAWRIEYEGMQVDTRMAWGELRAILVDGADWIVESRSGVAVVRGRAFASPADAESFWNTVERLCEPSA